MNRKLAIAMFICLFGQWNYAMAGEKLGITIHFKGEKGETEFIALERIKKIEIVLAQEEKKKEVGETSPLVMFLGGKKIGQIQFIDETFCKFKPEKKSGVEQVFKYQRLKDGLEVIGVNDKRQFLKIENGNAILPSNIQVMELRGFGIDGRKQ